MTSDDLCSRKVEKYLDFVLAIYSLFSCNKLANFNTGISRNKVGIYQYKSQIILKKLYDPKN